MRISFLLLTLPLLLAACGQKGPLYLPEQKAQAGASATVPGGNVQSDNKNKPAAK